MNFSVKGLFSILLPGLLLATSVQPQEQNMYTWTDENGVVHFSDMQPQGQQAQERQVPRNPSPGDASPYASPGETGPSYADQKRQQIAASKQATRQQQAANSARCSSWKAELNRLEPNRRVFFTNENGETERMDDVERTNRVADLKARIAQNCQ